MPSQPIRPLSRWIRIPSVQSFAIAPNGRLGAVAWEKHDSTQIYLVPLTGRGRPRAVTIGSEYKTAPRFSPDGTRLLYAQDYGGDENFDLWVYEFATGQCRNLTPATPATINPEACWSPDGEWIAYVSDRDGPMATYIQHVATGAVRRMTAHAYTDAAVEWSPDGQTLAVTANTRGQLNGVFLVPLADHAPVRMLTPTGDLWDAMQPRWSPDSQSLALISNDSGMASLYTYTLATQHLHQETRPTHEASAPAWSPDGRQLTCVWNEDGNERLVIKSVRARTLTTVGAAAGVHMTPQFSPDGRQLFALYNGPRHPMDLWAIPLSGGRPRPITRSLPQTFPVQALVAPHVVRWTSDDLTVAGLLYLPKGFRRTARVKPGAVIYVHGGPTWQFKNEWYVVPQALANAGLVVLAPNYRGSTGYGRAFQDANRYDLGGGDMRDVVAGVNWLIQQGYADPARIGITGMSYGGYLTLTALTRHAGVFAAGSAVVPFLNWFTEHASEREDLKQWDLENFGDPIRDAERYRTYSPINYMDQITAPLQMLAGGNDTRCPANETEQAAEVLTALGRPPEVVIYPGEGHFFHQYATRLDAFERRITFLTAHLQRKE